MATATATLSRQAALAVPARLPVTHLSHSSLALFWRCPERWRRRYVLRERESVGGPAVIGKAVGAALTARFAAQIAGEPLSLRDADDLYLAEFDDAAPAAFFKDKEPPAVLRRQGRQALVAYLARVAPTLRPVSVERKVELRFDGAQWSFLGYLDVEDAQRDVIDLKVKAKHLSQAEADHSAQASAYLLARSLEGRPAKGFAFHSLRRGAKRADVHVVQTERSADQLAAFERRLAQTARDRALCRDRRLGLRRPGGLVVLGGAERLPVLRLLPGRGRRRGRRPRHRHARAPRAASAAARRVRVATVMTERRDRMRR